MKTLKFKLKGLTCNACVKLVTNRIKRIPGVQEVEIEIKTGDTKVTSQANINLDLIRQSLLGADYNVISETI